MERSRFGDDDEVSANELAYLQHRYPDPADVAERRERINAVLKRLSQRNVDLREVHRLLVAPRYEWRREHRRDSPELVKLKARARRDLARAVASLRALLGDEEQALYTDDKILRMRGALLGARPPVRRPGRPQQKGKATHKALQRAGVRQSDRFELLAAFGFIEDEP